MVHTYRGEGLCHISSGHAKCHAVVHMEHVIVMCCKEDISVTSAVLMLQWGPSLHLACSPQSSCHRHPL